MSKKRIVFIPALLAGIAAVILLAYSLIINQPERPGAAEGTRSESGAYTNTQDKQGDQAYTRLRSTKRNKEKRDEEGYQELFKKMGTVAAWSAGISYGWYFLKKKRKSLSGMIRFGVKLFYAVHTYTGYAALVLIAVHGGYFLLYGDEQNKIWSGIAAFLLLFAAGAYGYLIRRVRNTYMRNIHWGLGTAFIAAGIVHAGGNVIAVAASLLGLWVLIQFMERRTLKSAA